MDHRMESLRPSQSCKELLRKLDIDSEEGSGRRSVVAVRQRPLGWGHRSRFEVLQLLLKGGQKVSLVVKDFGTTEMRTPEAAPRYTRERSVYGRLLAGSGIDTPRYHGSLCNPAQSRYLLVLEYVAGERLHWRDAHHFELAAAWLGKMQALFSLYPEKLANGVPLVRHDARFFQVWAARAHATATRISTNLERRLANVFATYQGLIEDMAAGPPTLVHGGFRRRHVLISPGDDSVRVRTVDWGRAGLGSPLFDLASISEGCTRPTRERMFYAYRDVLVRRVAQPPDGWQMRRLLTCFRLHNTFATLAQLAAGPHAERAATRIAESAERLARQVREEAFDE